MNECIWYNVQINIIADSILNNLNLLFLLFLLSLNIVNFNDNNFTTQSLDDRNWRLLKHTDALVTRYPCVYFVFINFSLGTFISFLDVSPPSIVECMYVGNYITVLSLTSASDQRQYKLAQGTRSRSERVVHARRCRLCIILDFILQQWQFSAAWHSHPTSECR